MTYVLGIDPGPVIGLVGLHIDSYTRKLLGSPEVIQCSANCLQAVLDGLDGPAHSPLLVAVERFVVGPRAARSSAPGAGTVTRAVVDQVARWTQWTSADNYIERSAAEVKPWATDTRLAAAGLLEPTKGMRHARDAARHALFAAVKDCGLADPLSARGRAA